MYECLGLLDTGHMNTDVVQQQWCEGVCVDESTTGDHGRDDRFLSA